MEYRKPTVSVLAKAISAVRGSNLCSKGTLYIDGQGNPGGHPPHFKNDCSPAYEADE